ncbi:ORF6N domain-containing protein [Flavobacterium sp. F372]|uniref:ORF6N domain-containing protein n=1 Tax=Flavobacterium bernardetii TaxID=2813823 RepID=A0ABR7J257_9FLAO|nr:ORF6N domain-containing protein [Flavobacterium bernardetii]MBC5836111.1 ORF6N domain-containing protein [Flavobacterium bernardetii]NHF71296.1 ORF6N domain-containing protein [Flavobacterium bernardetii]
MNNLEIITNKIHIIRNQKVMLDYDLAALYEVETRVLKQSVKRNIERFPEDFMFELTENEIEIVVSQFVIPSKSFLGGAKPFAFTEQGLAMLSGVLKSEKAIKINIAIMRTFVILRNSLLNLEEITSKVKEIENQFPEIYKILNYLMNKEDLKTEQEDRTIIGYKK